MFVDPCQNAHGSPDSRKTLRRLIMRLFAFHFSPYFFALINYRVHRYRMWDFKCLIWFSAKDFPLQTLLLAERVPEIWFRVHRISGKMGLRQVEQGISSFFTKFLAYLMIFQSGVHERQGCQKPETNLWVPSTQSITNKDSLKFHSP